MAESTRSVACRYAVLAVFALSAVGCGAGDGLSDYERQKRSQQNAADALRSAGAKLTEVNNPQGQSWAVNLSGMRVSDEIFDRLKKVGYITELDISKTNVTDEQMARVNEVEIGSLLLKLDLSNTAVTDAGLEKLDNLLLLGNMNLTGTKVTAAAVERFKKKRTDDPKIMEMFKSPTIRR